MSTTTTPVGWLEKEFDAIKTWVIGEVDKLKPLVDIADALVNKIKTLETSQVGQFLLTELETLIPASSGLVNAFKLQFPKWVLELNIITDYANETDEQIWQQVVTYINGISDPDVKAAQLNTLKSLFSKFFAGNSDQALTMPQALTLSPTIHDPNIIAAT